MAHCGIFVWCIVGFVRWDYWLYIKARCVGDALHDVLSLIASWSFPLPCTKKTVLISTVYGKELKHVVEKDTAGDFRKLCVMLLSVGKPELKFLPHKGHHRDDLSITGCTGVVNEITGGADCDGKTIALGNFSFSVKFHEKAQPYEIS